MEFIIDTTTAPFDCTENHAKRATIHNNSEKVSYCVMINDAAFATLSNLPYSKKTESEIIFYAETNDFYMYLIYIIFNVKTQNCGCVDCSNFHLELRSNKQTFCKNINIGQQYDTLQKVRLLISCMCFDINFESEVTHQCQVSHPLYVTIYFKWKKFSAEIDPNMFNLLSKLNNYYTNYSDLIFIFDNLDDFNYIKYIITSLKSYNCNCNLCLANRTEFSDENRRNSCENINIIDQYIVLKELGLPMCMLYSDVHKLIGDEYNYYYLEILPKIEKIAEKFKSNNLALKFTVKCKFTQDDYKCFKKIMKEYFYQNNVKELHAIARFKLLFDKIDENITFE